MTYSRRYRARMAYKLGLKAPVPGAIPLRLATYMDFHQLPTPPAVFGHYQLISDWGMLANDQLGDCAIAGACHQTMLWTLEGSGVAASFDDTAAITNYSAITGYNPDDPSTDEGTALGQLAAYWRTYGIVDAAGKRHKVAAVVDINPGDLRELWVSSWLFQAVGLGYLMPQSAMDQTAAGKPWNPVRGSPIEGGHYVPLMGRNPAGNGVIITWGQTQEVTPAFHKKYNDQGIAALSEEMLDKAASVDGFNETLLKQDLATIGLP
jgi:hypothetical protein